MAAINNVNNHPHIPQGNHALGESKKLDDIVRKKKIDDEDALSALPVAFTGSAVQQHSLLRLSLACRGHDGKGLSDNSVTADPTVMAEVTGSRSLATELVASGLSQNADKPAERTERGEIKTTVKEPGLTKSLLSEGAGTDSVGRTLVSVTGGENIKITQQTNSRARVEQGTPDFSDKTLTNRNDVTVMQPLPAQQGSGQVEIKERAVVKRDSQQVLLANADGVDTGRVPTKEPVNASSNLTYNFSKWGSGHQVNVQLAAQHGIPLVLNPSDNLVQERLADQGTQDDRGQPRWIFRDEQEQQQSRGGRPPKYVEELQ